MKNDIELRSLESPDDYEQCLELQQLTWGDDFRELVPPTIVRISQKVGGVAAGAFDHHGRMLGFVYGLTGLRQGRKANWSHMLAVRPEARGLGLGRDLKWFQRDVLLPLGVDVVYWTYDPLIARNANLNLNRLGARPDEYVIDMYGPDTGSELHSGLGTDRFIVAWEIGSGLVESLAQATETTLTQEPSEGELILDSLDTQTGTLVAAASSSGPVWVEIPADIDEIKSRDMDESRRWRAGSQRALVELLSKGFHVDGFSRTPAGRYAYRVSKSHG